MQTAEQTLTARRQAQSSTLPTAITVNTEPAVNTSLLDRLEMESLMLNMDASLRVHGRHHFFTWTQGLLQNLIRHEVLICAFRNAGPGSFQVESFTTSADDTRLFSDLFRQDVAVVPHLVKTWEDNHYQPVICEIKDMSSSNALVREWTRVGASTVLAHGTYDAFGKVASLFTFACRPEAIGPKQVYFAELMVPFLELAWMRISTSRSAEATGANASVVKLITPREQEILKWIQLGKSNIEIGLILDISPLTVKNHVQKLLRKLNVQNRAQAVGKALALRILTM